jgi:hypothetical protein
MEHLSLILNIEIHMHSSSIYTRTGRTGLISCLFMILLSSCYKEPRLTPGTADILYTLPQGDHPYDNEILDFYNTYGTFILYKWTTADFQYAVTGPLSQQLQVFPADTNYVQQGLNFLHANLLDLYPDSFLKQTLPWRILLGSEIDSIMTVNSNTLLTAPVVDTVRNTSATSVSGQHQISLFQVDSVMPNLTPAQVAQARGWLNRAYWQQATSNNVVEIPPAFDSVTNYQNVDDQNYVSMGVLYFHDDLSFATPSTDFIDYVFMITSTPFQQINATWFSPQTDVNGFIRGKYNIIVQYYLANYGVDLQAIGNLP